MFGIGKLLAVVAVQVAVVFAAPDFGPNVLIFDPTMPAAQIQSAVDSITAKMQNNHFGPERYALLFKPGQYTTNIQVGFYTQVLGLGQLPGDVHFTSQIKSEPYLPNNDGTQNFWRGIENFAITPTTPDHYMQWAVSQAVPFRRMHVHGNVALHKYGGWVSGGWISDSIVDYDVQTASQQQWLSRNSNFGSWSGALWNMMFVGIGSGLPGGTWPTTANTFVDTAPVTREKPFLTIDGAGNYNVFVPSLQRNSKGPTWAPGRQSPGTSISIDKFYVAKAGTDSAASINNALSQGKHILFTPGIYDLTDTIVVNNPNTIVLGIGLATLHPITGKTAIATADVDGIILAGLMLDAGPTNSPFMLQVGPPGSSADHSANPTIIQDVFIRVGGAGNAKVDVGMQINSNDVIGDHFWVWRADHGAGAGWDTNPSKNGVIVNGNRVTIYGLFVEHFEEYQTLWRGQNGRTYFYQSEIPYDPPTQAAYTSGPGVNGWASYKVDDSVNSHEAWGLGIYSVFTYPNVSLSRAIETPVRPNVKFHHMVTVNLTPRGAIERIINDAGDSTAPGIAVNTPRYDDYPSANTPTTAPAPTTRAPTPAPTSAPTTPTPSSGSCNIENGVDYVGNDVGVASGAKATDCCSACSTFAGAKAFTWVPGTCYCKSGKGATSANANLVSGTFGGTTTTPAPAPAPTTAAPGTCTLSADTNFVANDVGTADATAAKDCCTACKKFSTAKAFSFLGNTCYCKSAKGATNAQAGVTSGVFA